MAHWLGIPFGHQVFTPPMSVLWIQALKNDKNEIFRAARRRKDHGNTVSGQRAEQVQTRAPAVVPVLAKEPSPIDFGEGLNFRTESRGAGHGQMDLTRFALKGDVAVGRTDYSVLQTESPQFR